ncbi:MAG: hypothetical protein V2B18_19080 [Pseudomonadota bacterium]
MGFIGKLVALIRGFFIRAGDDMVSSSPEAIRATYAAAINDAGKRYKDMQQAVALLAREREKTEQSLKQLDADERELQKKLEGSLAMAQAEPDNPQHREAGGRYIARLNEIDQKQGLLAGELDAQSKRVEEYKVKLRSFTDEMDRLRREQGEMVAEFVSSQQVIQLEDRLKGLSESGTDESIVAIRDRVSKMRSEAKIATEMRSAASSEIDVQYERAGAERQAASQFDDLLKARAGTKAAVDDKERNLG